MHLEGLVIFLVLIYGSFHVGAGIGAYPYWQKRWVFLSGPFTPTRKGRNV